MKSTARGADIPARLLALLRNAYGPELAADQLTLLNAGKYGNANVYRLELGQTRLLVKEFYSRPWLVRCTFGRLLVAREARALAALAGVGPTRRSTRTPKCPNAGSLRGCRSRGRRLTLR